MVMQLCVLNAPYPKPLVVPVNKREERFFKQLGSGPILVLAQFLSNFIEMRWEKGIVTLGKCLLYSMSPGPGTPLGA